MKIAIVGGGFTGLAAAYYLSKNNKNQVVVFEKNSFLGGLAASFKMDNGYLEQLVHHFFRKDKKVVDLVSELGLGSRLVWRKAKNAVFYKGKVYPFTSPFDLLSFSPLSFMDRIRCGLFSFCLKSQKNFRLFEEKTADEWLRSYMGEGIYKVIWQPLLKKKFGQRYREISMAWFWARIFYRSASLGYLKGSLQILIEEMVKRINKNKGEIKVNRKIKDSESLTKKFDKVIVTTSPGEFLKMTKKQLPRDYQRKLEKIDYFSAVSLVISLKKKLTDFYWININDYNLPFLVCVEHNNFVDSEDYDSRVVYLEDYFSTQDKTNKLSANQLFKKWAPFLARINPDFKMDWVNSYRVFKKRFAQPIINVGYPAEAPPMATPLKNVLFASMCQVYPQDRGVNYALKLGEKVARLIK